MSIIRFNNGSGYFSGDISANDVSFNNVDIEENLKVRCAAEPPITYDTGEVIPACERPGFLVCNTDINHMK